ncbi:MAG: hypothetical protein IH991_05640, partial [Planctomycetes bacterium]|nr:hypothetical protein [Planctomycetota bacterium]
FQQNRLTSSPSIEGFESLDGFRGPDGHLPVRWSRKEDRLLESVFQVLLNDEVAANRFHIVGNALLVNAADGMHNQVEKFLTRLRQIVSSSEPAEFQSPPLAISPLLEVVVYDIRSLLAKNSELDQRQLVGFLKNMASPFSWWRLGKDRVAWTHDFMKVGPSDARAVIVDGALVVRQHSEHHEQIAHVLRFLMDETDDFPRICDLASDRNDSAVAQLLTILDTDDDTLRRSYALTLLGSLEQPTQTVADVLVQLLDNTDPSEHREDFFRICEALQCCGPLAAKAIPGLRDAINTKDLYSIENARVAQTLAALGPKAMPWFSGWINAGRSLPFVINILADTGPWSKEVLPALLEQLRRNQPNDRPPFVSAIQQLDPGGKLARALVQEWRKDRDPEIRLRVNELGKLLEVHFPKPGPGNSGGVF